MATKWGPEMMNPLFVSSFENETKSKIKAALFVDLQHRNCCSSKKTWKLLNTDLVMCEPPLLLLLFTMWGGGFKLQTLCY